MRLYIFKHESADNQKKVIAEFEELVLISQCHSQSKRYPVIKNWFLDKYPEIKEFGISNEKNKVTNLSATIQELKKAS